MNEWVAAGALFVAVFAGCFGVLQFVIWRRSREVARLQAAQMGSLDSSPDLILGDMTPVLAETMPIQGEKRSELNQELIQAGMYSPTAVADYAAVRFVAVVIPLLVAGVLCLLIDTEYVPYVAMIGLILAAFGFSVPRVYVNYLGRVRRSDIQRGLPVAVDLMALGLIGGQNIMGALRRVIDEIRHAFPALAEELAIVRQQAELNDLAHALAQFADRVQITEVRNLVIILSQSQRQGTDVASALMEFVNNFRTSMRQEADKRANQASFWLIFPSIFLLWLPAFAILVAPITFELASKRDETKASVEESQKAIGDTLRNQGKGGTPAAPPGPGAESK